MACSDAFLGYILFFFNDPATTEIYTLSLHDALPIWRRHGDQHAVRQPRAPRRRLRDPHGRRLARHPVRRSEEHTSELQSRQYLVCRLLLVKKTKLGRISSRQLPVNPPHIERSFAFAV